MAERKPAEKKRDAYREQYGVIIICDDEAHQKRVYDDLRGRGYRPRVVAT